MDSRTVKFAPNGDAMEGTEIVYVCSPDYVPTLEVSLQSLLASGSELDRISIYLTGEAPKSLLNLDGRVVVNEVEPLFDSYFHGNKLFVCDSQYRRAIFLDADTLVLRPLQGIYQGKSADLLARPGAANNAPGWDQKTWESTFSKLGLTNSIPMLNAGLLIFQNGSHIRVRPHWAEYIQQYRAHKLSYPSNDLRMFEQWALSLATSKVDLKVTELGPTEHAFGWRGDCADGAVVFHTGARLFDRYSSLFEPFPKDEESMRQAVRMLVRTELEDAQDRISTLENRLYMLQRKADRRVSLAIRMARFARRRLRTSLVWSLCRRLAVSIRNHSSQVTGERG